MMLQIRFMTTRSDHKFTWDHARALMDQLIKRMLPISAGFPPNDGPRMIGQSGAIHGNALTIAFHFKLLKIGGQSRQPLIIRQHRAGRIIAHLVMPNPNKRQ